MNSFIDIVKYLVYGMIVYVLFSFVPQHKLPLSDVLVITIVIMMTYMLLDFLAPYNDIENLDPDFIAMNQKIETLNENFANEKNIKENLDPDLISNENKIEHLDPDFIAEEKEENLDSTELDPLDLSTKENTVSEEKKISEESKDISDPIEAIDNSNLASLKELKQESDMKYSQLDPELHKPLGEFTKDFNNKFEYGYSYLNTDKWSVPMYRPPVCKTDESCKVCSSATKGYPVDVKEWNSSTKVMPPDNINVEYISKLNRGE